MLFGNNIAEWAVATLATLLVFTVLKGLHWLLCRALERLAARTTTTVDDGLSRVVRRTKTVFFAALSLYWGSIALSLAPGVRTWIDRVALLVVLLQIGLWASSSLRVAIEVWAERRGDADASGAQTFSVAFRLLGNLLIWSLLIVFALSNFGVEVSALVAGLGVGGVAVALAAQTVLGDLFASMSIYLDRPFDIGDPVLVEGTTGIVETVGVRSSRIRAVTGELVVIPNRKLVDAWVRNFGRLERRGVVFTLGIEYGTTPERIEQVPGIVARAVESVAEATFERCHFRRFGASSLEFEVAYSVAVRALADLAAREHRVNLEIYRRFAEAGIAFAFPTQTVHVRGEAGAPGVVPSAS